MSGTPAYHLVSTVSICDVTVQPPPLSELQESTKGAVNESTEIAISSPKKIEKRPYSPQLQNTQQNRIPTEHS